MNAVNDSSLDLDQTDKENLIDDLSDEALEAAGMGRRPARYPAHSAHS